jgi:Flp pilus assembly protein CpaB
VILWSERYRRVRRRVLARRRSVAALLAAVAVFATVRTLQPRPAPTQPVVVAAHDLDAGSLLGQEDLATTRLRPGQAPQGALPAADLTGRTVAAPVRAGTPLTDRSVVGPGLAAGYPGRVVVPVRLGDPDVATRLRPGDHIDLVAARPDGGEARVVALDAVVVTVPPPADDGASALDSGSLVVVAVAETTAPALAEAGVSAFISPVLRR